MQDLSNLSLYDNKKSNKERAEMVGKNLALLRKRAGLSQNQLTKLIDVAVQTYSGYENGKHEPTIETLVRLSFLYDVPIDDIVGKYEGVSEEFEDIWLDRQVESIAENPKFEQIQVQIQEQKEQMAMLKQAMEEMKKHIQKNDTF